MKVALQACFTCGLARQAFRFKQICHFYLLAWQTGAFRTNKQNTHKVCNDENGQKTPHPYSIPRSCYSLKELRHGQCAVKVVYPPPIVKWHNSPITSVIASMTLTTKIGVMNNEGLNRKHVHWIGLYLSFHFSWGLRPFIHCRQQNL